MQTQIDQQTLTPAQFVIARALACAYSHHWSGVPDGTLAIAEIEAWSQAHANTIPGINAPYINEDGWVVHTTHSGRLDWEISPSGIVVLSVNRPDPTQAKVNEIVAEKLGQNSIEWSGYKVARIEIHNAAIDDNGFPDTNRFAVGEILISASSWKKTHKENGGVKLGWIYDPQLRDDLLFARHVGALVRPLVALLRANEPDIDGPLADPESDPVDLNTESEAERHARWDREHARYQDWRARAVEPAIARAKEILAPLFAISLPNPVDEDRVDNKPETYWTRKVIDDVRIDPEDGIETIFGDKTAIEVVHHGQRFPVESEKTAVHAVLLLKNHMDMPFLEAIQLAIRSNSYKP